MVNKEIKKNKKPGFYLITGGKPGAEQFIRYEKLVFPHCLYPRRLFPRGTATSRSGRSSGSRRSTFQPSHPYDRQWQKWISFRFTAAGPLPILTGFS